MSRTWLCIWTNHPRYLIKWIKFIISLLLINGLDWFLQLRFFLEPNPVYIYIVDNSFIFVWAVKSLNLIMTTRTPIMAQTMMLCNLPIKSEFPSDLSPSQAPHAYFLPTLRIPYFQS